MLFLLVFSHQQLFFLLGFYVLSVFGEWSMLAVLVLLWKLVLLEFLLDLVSLLNLLWLLLMLFLHFLCVLFLVLLFLFLRLFLGRVSLWISRLLLWVNHRRFSSLFGSSSWNWSNGWLLYLYWFFRNDWGFGIMRWLTMLDLFVAGMLFLLLMMLLSLLLLLVVLDGFDAVLLLADDALIVEVGRAHSIASSSGWLDLHVLVHCTVI
jgi:hypothetical protein